MEHKEVKSSNIKSVAYEPETKVLEIMFNNDNLFQYNDVPIDVYTSLMQADSIGKHFHSNIKNKFKALNMKVKE